MAACRARCGRTLAGTARVRVADHGDHQRRAHADLAVARDDSALRPLSWPRVGGACRRIPSVWRRLDQIPDAELWRTHERRRERLVAFARRRLRRSAQDAAALPPAEIAPRRRSARPRGPDHRLRPPLRHLQARLADLPQPGAPDRPPQQQGPAGSADLRRQGPPAITAARS